MNSLLLLDGSPRGERSNSMKMLQRVAEGWQRAGGATAEVLHLARREQLERAVEAFAGAHTVLLGMPLYTDAMPAIDKEYIEALAPRVATSRTGAANPTLAFLVQSGFPEALHSRPLERYFVKLAARLGSSYAGTIVHGGGGMLEGRPEKANKKLWEQLRILGEQLAREGHFGAAELKSVAGLERFSPAAAALMDMACKLRLLEFPWNGMLKKNGVWEQRFAAPYGNAYR
jgi:hypothetical protein